MGKKEHFAYFSKCHSDPQEYLDVLKNFFNPLHFLLWVKGPDATGTAEESLPLSLTKLLQAESEQKC